MSRLHLLKIIHNRLAQNVRFEVESPAGFSTAERRQFQRRGYQRDFKNVFVGGGDGETDAVDGDRAFGRQVFRERVGGFDAETRFILVGDLMHQDADGVDVALDEMAVETIAEFQRAFDVDAIAGGEAAEVGSFERFFDDVEIEAAGSDLGDGEAAAVKCDAFAEFYGVILPIVGDDQSAKVRAVAGGDNRKGFFDNSREHCFVAATSLQQHTSMTRTLKDMIVVITGASAGIGKALAEELSPQGAKLVLAARRMDRLEQLNKSLGGGHLCVQADVSRLDDCHHLIDQAKQRFGRIDTLVCNAGYGLFRLVRETTPDDVRAIFATNVFGTTDCIDFALPIMSEQSERDGWRGQIMIVSSCVARRGIPFIGMYSATKAAQLSVAEAMRVELKPLRIAVTSVHPVHTETEFGKVAEQMGDVRMGDVPMGQSAELVARKMVKAIQRPRPELWPLRAARCSFGIATMMPRFVDWVAGMYRAKIERANANDKVTR